MRGEGPSSFIDHPLLVLSGELSRVPLSSGDIYPAYGGWREDS